MTRSSPNDLSRYANNAIRKDPYERWDEMQPMLDEETLSWVRGHGEIRSVDNDTVLFDVGDQQTHFICVLSGKLAIEVDGCDGLTTIVEHERGRFTGEIDMFSNRGAVVRARCVEAGEMVFIDRDEFRRMLARNAEFSELVMRAFILRRTGLISRGLGDVTLVGSVNDSALVSLRAFLTRNGHPYRLVDPDEESELFERLATRYEIGRDELPAVVHKNERALKRPSARELADRLGLSQPSGNRDVYDVAVVGVGPGGLAAAVNAAAEGLSVIAIEGHAPGGQAGTSSKIENYPAFPTGISGQALGGRMMLQAQKFGAEIIAPREVARLDCSCAPYALVLEDGEEIKAHSVVISSGAKWRRLGLENEQQFENAGIYYGATAVEAMLCQRQEVAIVGGGNSAGQAAVYLSKVAAHVHILVRGDSLSSSMSSYLIERIEATDNITLHVRTEVVAMQGESHLEGLEWRSRPLRSDGSESKSSEAECREKVPVRHLFVMIGAVPNTDWLRNCLLLDEKGFVLTGADLPTRYLVSRDWNAGRMPFIGETSMPGIFAVGDVRSGSVKRVASAVGEGAVAAQFLYRVVQDRSE
ncbi:MAG: FAD-dependent oxidoreductase [Myxococcota bacterium]